MVDFVVAIRLPKEYGLDGEKAVPCRECKNECLVVDKEERPVVCPACFLQDARLTLGRDAGGLPPEMRIQMAEELAKIFIQNAKAICSRAVIAMDVEDAPGKLFASTSHSFPDESLRSRVLSLMEKDHQK